MIRHVISTIVGLHYRNNKLVPLVGKDILETYRFPNIHEDWKQSNIVIRAFDVAIINFEYIIPMRRQSSLINTFGK